MKPCSKHYGVFCLVPIQIRLDNNLGRRVYQSRPVCPNVLVWETVVCLWGGGAPVVFRLIGVLILFGAGGKQASFSPLIMQVPVTDREGIPFWPLCDVNYTATSLLSSL